MLKCRNIMLETLCLVFAILGNFFMVKSFLISSDSKDLPSSMEEDHISCQSDLWRLSVSNTLGHYACPFSSSGRLLVMPTCFPNFAASLQSADEHFATMFQQKYTICLPPLLCPPIMFHDVSTTTTSKSSKK